MSSIMMDIDCELLIPMVQDRPVLWDRESAGYKNKDLTKQAWAEICEELIPGFEEMDENNQGKSRDIVIKKWRNVIDANNRSLKNRQIDGSKRRKYIFHKQLEFLKKNACYTEAIYFKYPKFEKNTKVEAEDEDPIDEDSTTSSSIHRAETSQSKKSKIEKPKKVDVVKEEEEVEEEIDEVKPKTNRHMSFFGGITPSLELFNDDEIVEFQLSVLQTISSIKKRKSDRQS